MNYQEVCQWFEDNAWQSYPLNDIDRCDKQYFKSFPDAPQCRTNQPKPLQIRAEVFDMTRYSDVPNAKPGIELSICAEPKKCSGWIVFKAYAINSVADVPLQCERLLKAWDAVAE